MFGTYRNKRFFQSYGGLRPSLTGNLDQNPTTVNQAGPPSIIAIETWDTYGASGSLPTIFPYNVLYPQYFSIGSVNKPPWNPRGKGSYLDALNPQGASGKVGPGVYTLPGRYYQSSIFGFWFYINAWPSGGGGLGTGPAIFRFNDSRVSDPSTTQFPPTGVDHCYLWLSGQSGGSPAQGAISGSNANTPDGTNAGGTSTILLSLQTWYFLEWWVYLGDTNGANFKLGQSQFNINGAVGFKSLNCQTRWTGNNGYGLDTITIDAEEDFTGELWFGPWYWMDDNGAGPAAMLGQRYFQTTFPNSDNTVQFTPSTGSHSFSIVNSVPPGPNYVSDNTQGQQDFLNDTTLGIDQINTISTQIVAENDAQSGRMGAPIIKSGGTTGIGQSFGLSNGIYQAFVAMFPTDPNTGLPWTSTALAAALSGYEVLQ